VKEGPPIYISDKHALPLADEDNDTHICQLWYAEDGLERSAILKGAYTGNQRQELWDQLKALLTQMEESSTAAAATAKNK
jgi:hypothetical protein